MPCHVWIQIGFGMELFPFIASPSKTVRHLTELVRSRFGIPIRKQIMTMRSLPGDCDVDTENGFKFLKHFRILSSLGISGASVPVIWLIRNDRAFGGCEFQHQVALKAVAKHAPALCDPSCCAVIEFGGEAFVLLSTGSREAILIFHAASGAFVRSVYPPCSVFYIASTRSRNSANIAIADHLRVVVTSTSELLQLEPASLAIQRTSGIFKTLPLSFPHGAGWVTLSPTGICYSADGSILFVCNCDDESSQVLAIDVTSHELKFLFGTYGDQSGQLYYPSSICVTSNFIVVVDNGSGKHTFVAFPDGVARRIHPRIHVFSLEGVFLRQLGEFDECKVDNLGMPLPDVLGWDELGSVCASHDQENVMVADTTNDRVLIFRVLDAQLLFTLGLKHESGIEHGKLEKPGGVCVTADGELLVLDGNRLRLQYFSACQ